MDPITAALNAYAETLQFLRAQLDAASPELKAEMMQRWWDETKWWRDLIDKLFKLHS